MLQSARLIARQAGCAFVLFLFSSVGFSQAPAPPSKAPEPAATDTAKTTEPHAVDGQDKEKKTADPASDRQKQLADDTAKLLVLANELKAEMDKSTRDTLSLTVVKKAEEVEKLAHKVRDEMKKSIGN